MAFYIWLFGYLPVSDSGYLPVSDSGYTSVMPSCLFHSYILLFSPCHSYFFISLILFFSTSFYSSPSSYTCFHVPLLIRYLCVSLSLFSPSRIFHSLPPYISSCTFALAQSYKVVLAFAIVGALPSH